MTRRYLCIGLAGLGLQSGDYSLPYVTRWAAGHVEVVKQSAERAVSCAKQILVTLDATSDGVSTSDTRTDIITP